MLRSISFVALAVLLVPGLAAWAGPAEEVAQIAGPRVQALEEGNLDCYALRRRDELWATLGRGGLYELDDRLLCRTFVPGRERIGLSEDLPAQGE